MEIIQLTPDGHDQWDQFVRKANNGNLFHYRKFLTYHIGRNFVDIQQSSPPFWEVMRWAPAAGFRYLDFGVSRLPLEDNPLTPSKSLIMFKERFGSRNMLRKALEKRF